MYRIDDFVRVAKRENNAKRPYLYINPHQGKHIPVSPARIKSMCRGLADIVNQCYANERIFAIGFAETATAISAYTAQFIKGAVYYENTTREDIKGADYLYFTESHSHAAQQKLNVRHFEAFLPLTDRILFIEDEVTTGNTICKLICELEQKYSRYKLHYSIASILNSMPESRVAELQNQGIECLWLQKLPFEYQIQTIENLNMEHVCMHDLPPADCIHSICLPDSMDRSRLHSPTADKLLPPLHIKQVHGMVNPRHICQIADYSIAVTDFCSSLYESDYAGEHTESLLVLGTEECMYPAIALGDYLLEKGYCTSAKTHSTTRSPILAVAEEGYPLTERFKLRSLYDTGRITYLYNLKKYDKVILVTDARLLASTMPVPPGLIDLLYFLGTAGNQDIAIYQWSE